ncbi:MAG TPA: ATP-binding cassette domain-containing protein [Firmicutes bacterium]|nr:ATP-binding cassette domain-containing protein [Bacillota bacterium]
MTPRLIGCFLSCLIILVSANPANAQGRTKLKVAVTLPDIVTIVEAVGSGMVEVVPIMPHGADPHGYTITADDISKIQSAELIIFANSEFLHFEKELAENIADKRVIDWVDYQAKGAQLKSFPRFENNPHGFWLGFNNARAIAEAVAVELIEMGLVSDAVLLNLTEFTRTLNSIEKVGKDLIISTGRERSSWVAVIPGVAYTIDNLGLKVAEIVMTEGSATVSGADLIDLHHKLSTGEYAGIVCPLSMMQSKPGEIARQISTDTGAPVCYVKFLEAGKDDNFWSISAYNAGSITAAAKSAVRLRGSADATGSIIWASIVFILLIWIVMLYRRMGIFTPSVPKSKSSGGNNKKRLMEQQIQIEAENLSFTYHRPRVNALRGVSFSIRQSSFIAVMGPNGSGKSTLLMLILGLLTPDSGELRVLGHHPWQNRDLTQRSMGYVPQRDQVNERFPISVRDVVLQAVGARHLRSKNRGSVFERIEYILEMVDLVDLADQPFGTLSGGQQQRALIGRALAVDPEILLLDEPFSAVDLKSQVLIAGLLKRLTVERKVTVIAVVHNINPLVHYIDSVMLLNGELVAFGPSEDVLITRILSRAYGNDVPVVICDDGFRHPLMEDTHGKH